MLYVPILKNRQNEMIALKAMNDYFSDSIIPYIEVISANDVKVYKTDSVGNFVRETKDGRNVRIKETPSINDICRHYSEIVGPKKSFLEFFRFSNNEYRSFDPQKVFLSLEIRADYNRYVDATTVISHFNNLIPVVSIKKGFALSGTDLKKLLSQIKDNSESLAVRIDISLYDDYREVLSKLLSSNDYIIVDIRERGIASQRFYLKDINRQGIAAKWILFNSPRTSEMTKAEYCISGWEESIDNTVVEEYLKLGFDGFGDYAGLCDVLPANVPNSKILCLALIYDRTENKFWSVRNDNVEDRTNGFVHVKKELLDLEELFNPDGSCKAYELIRSASPGNHGYWNKIIVVRYICEMYKKIKT